MNREFHQPLGHPPDPGRLSRLKRFGFELACQVLLRQAPIPLRQRVLGEHVAKELRGVRPDHPARQTGNARPWLGRERT